MVPVIQAASYMYQRYRKQFGTNMDEMKLHKLLYLAQRECMVQKGEPLFREQFQAWRYGPVMVDIRSYYATDVLLQPVDEKWVMPYLSVYDHIFQKYAAKDSWSLSTLTHGEYSWKKAREGYASAAKCVVEIKTEDIRKDAERIAIRRALLHGMCVDTKD